MRTLTAHSLWPTLLAALALSGGCGLDHPLKDPPPPLSYEARNLFPLTVGNRWTWEQTVNSNALHATFTIHEEIVGTEPWEGRDAFTSRQWTIEQDDTIKVRTLHYSLAGDTLWRAYDFPPSWSPWIIGVDDSELGDTLRTFALEAWMFRYFGDGQQVETDAGTFKNCVQLRYTDYFNLSELDTWIKPGIGIVRIEMRYYDTSGFPREPSQERTQFLTSYRILH